MLSAWTLWQPDYVAEGVVKGVTATVSVVTAVVLWPLIPHALALPSPAQPREANSALHSEVLERTRAEAQAREANALLARRVADRTSLLAAASRELAEVNASLEQRVAERTAALQKALHALKESEARAMP